MRRTLMAVAAAAVLVVPCAAQAQDPAAGAATGAAVGAGVGFAVGGPIGAAIGAGIGGTVGAGAADEANRAHVEERVIIEQRAPAAPVVRQRNCVATAAGKTICEEVRR